MKRVLFTLALAMLASASTLAQKYNVQGTWNDGKGKTVYLGEKKDKERIMIDSTVVRSDGTFTLNGTLPEPKEYVIVFDGVSENVFIADQPVITANIGMKKFKSRKGEESESLGCTIDGGTEQKVFDELNSMYMSKVISKLGMMLALSKNKDDKLAVDSLSRAFNYMNEKLEAQLRDKLDSCNNTIAMPYFVTSALLSEYKIEDLRSIYNNMTDRVKATIPGQNFKAAIERLSLVNIGGTAPDFTLKGPDGKDVTLSQLRGKIVLLDFWATWCGPCLRELPNVKSIYDKYHSKGLEILGVSLDDDKTEEAWKKMVVAREMTWHHGSSLQGWDCPVAKLYNVTAIPRMYIIDRDGKIIAQDLRGEALQQKMAELFE